MSEFKRRASDKEANPQDMKISLLEVEFRSFKEAYEKNQDANDMHWKNFYIFKEELLTNTRKPSSFKDIIIAIGSTLTVVSLVLGGVLTIVDSRLAVPIEQGKVVNIKVEELYTRQNELINLNALHAAKLSTLAEKVNDNTDFVNEYMYKEKIPSVLTSIIKDIEFIKIKE